MTKQPSTLPLDDAVEAITVAISLGMDVPVIHGMHVWDAYFQSDYESNSDELEALNCASEEIALAHIRNLIIPRLVARLAKNPILLRAPHRLPTLRAYVEDMSTEKLIKDYEQMFEVRFHMCKESVAGVVPEPTPFTAVEDIIAKYSAVEQEKKYAEHTQQSI